MKSVQFIHYRQYSSERDDVCSRGGATVAIRDDDNNKNQVLVSIARCNPHDVFNKKIGRNIAAGRIDAYLGGRSSLETQVRSVWVADDLDSKRVVADFLYDEMAETDLY